MLAAALTTPWRSPAQDSQVLTVAPPPRLVIARGHTAEVKLAVELKPGYHVNSHAPAEDYLIPLALSWEAKPFQILEIVYPKPQALRSAFAGKPMSVFTGTFSLVTRLRAPAEAPRGPGILLGKLRYQACTEKLCLPPKTVPVRLAYEIR